MENTEKEFDIDTLIDLARKEINLSRVEISDIQVKEIIEEIVLNSEKLKFENYIAKIKIVDYIFFTLRKELGILHPYAMDEEINEIMVNGINNIFVEKKGKIYKADVNFKNVEDLEDVIRRIGAKVQKEINELNPILDARLKDGSRVNAINKNIALGGPVLSIRKFPQNAIDMKKLIELEALTQEAADFLEILVISGYNIFISGGTSSGKTTFLNVLTDYIPIDERIIIIEDSAELQINNLVNVVRMECRNANSHGKGQIDMRSLIKTSLRMRPDRIIVGEVRGPEVLDMIQAMNTGHDGSLSTGHGNSPEGMLNRLEVMFLQAASYPIEAIRSQIAEGIDIIVHLGRTKENKRGVMKIAEIIGIKDNKICLNELFVFQNAKGLIKTNNTIINDYKLLMRDMEI